MARAVVVDASMALSWIFEDERNDYSLQVATYVREHGAAAPALWRWEVQNSLLTALRRKRITEDALASHMEDIVAIAIDIDVPFGFGTELTLAKQFNLTAYDAAYLELAMRRNCKLATNDTDLIKAAKSLGIFFKPERD